MPRSGREETTDLARAGGKPSGAQGCDRGKWEEQASCQSISRGLTLTDADEPDLRAEDPEGGENRNYEIPPLRTAARKLAAVLRSE